MRSGCSQATAAYSISRGTSASTSCFSRGKPSNKANACSVKQCSRCGLTLPLSEFARRRQDGALCNSYCKACQREYCRAHYRSNSATHNRRRMENAKRHRDRNRRNLYEFLQSKKCIDCGESDACVLDFDHVRGVKAANIGDLVTRPAAWQRILREIEKCEIRCANCHRRKTARDFKWFKGSFGA